MNKLTDWIKHHQVAAFFILAFMITWPLFILVFFVFPGNPIVQILTVVRLWCSARHSWRC